MGRVALVPRCEVRTKRLPQRHVECGKRHCRSGCSSVLIEQDLAACISIACDLTIVLDLRWTSVLAGSPPVVLVGGMVWDVNSKCAEQHGNWQRLATQGMVGVLQACKHRRSGEGVCAKSYGLRNNAGSSDDVAVRRCESMICSRCSGSRRSDWQPGVQDSKPMLQQSPSCGGRIWASGQLTADREDVSASLSQVAPAEPSS